MLKVFRMLAVPAGAVALFAAMPSAQVKADTVLAPGQSFVFTGSTTVTGTVLTEITGSYSNGAQQGTFTEDVVREGSGKLDFLFQVHNTGGTSVDRVSLTHYASGGVTVSADYASLLTLTGASTLAVPGGSTPLVVDRSTAPGDVIGFNWTTAGAVFPGTESAVLVIKTSATSYGGGGIAIIDGVTANAPALGPVSAPLPATASMGFGLLGGLGCLTGVNVLRRRRMT